MPRWQKGQSGNPRGRPPKSRVLSQVLTLRADDIIHLLDGQTTTNKEVVARMLWEFATTAKLTLSDRVLYAESVAEWINAVRWIYTHVDGPAPTTNPSDTVEIQIIRAPRLIEELK